MEINLDGVAFSTVWRGQFLVTIEELLLISTVPRTPNALSQPVRMLRCANLFHFN